MPVDYTANFAISTVATAPSPATSGTSLVVDSGDGSRFPDPATYGPYNIVVHATGELPTADNAEICRVTAKSSDTLTITRAAEGTVARTVVTGDLVYVGITAKRGNEARHVVAGTLEQVTNSATLQDDNELKLYVPADTIWAVRFDLCFTQASISQNGAKLAVLGPSGATGNVMYDWHDDDLTALDRDETTLGSTFTATRSSNTGVFFVTIFATVDISSTPGEIKLQWAQGTLHNSTMSRNVGSALIAHQAG